MALNLDEVEGKVLRCVQSAVNYLNTNRSSDEAVGINPYGDISKRFDVESDELLHKCISENLRDVVIVSEESSIRSYGTGKFVAIVDPIDGSTNYEADIPWSAVSVAIGLSKDGKTTLNDVVLALVAEVSRNRVYLYREGEVKILGANISRKSKPKHIVLGYFDSPQSFKALDLYMSYYGDKRVLRVLGSAALDIINVGLGNAEVFIDVRNKLRNVDIAAALRIALAMGAAAVAIGYPTPLDIPIDRVVRVGCVVGFDHEYLMRALEVLRQIGSLTETS